MVGVSRADLDRDPVEQVPGLDGRKVDVYRHTFPEIAVGEAAIHDFPMSIAQHFDRRDTFQMILGMDYIGKAHLWLSYTTNALYIDSGEKAPAVHPLGGPRAVVPKLDCLACQPQ